MATEIQTIKASQLVELTEVTDSNYVVVTDGATSKKVKATNLKGDLSNITSAVNLNSEKISEISSQLDSCASKINNITTSKKYLSLEKLGNETLSDTLIRLASVGGNHIIVDKNVLLTDTIVLEDNTVIEGLNTMTEIRANANLDKMVTFTQNCTHFEIRQILFHGNFNNFSCNYGLYFASETNKSCPACYIQDVLVRGISGIGFYNTATVFGMLLDNVHFEFCSSGGIIYQGHDGILNNIFVSSCALNSGQGAIITGNNAKYSNIKIFVSGNSTETYSNTIGGTGSQYNGIEFQENKKGVRLYKVISSSLNLLSDKNNVINATDSADFYLDNVHYSYIQTNHLNRAVQGIANKYGIKDIYSSNNQIFANTDTSVSYLFKSDNKLPTTDFNNTIYYFGNELFEDYTDTSTGGTVKHIGNGRFIINGTFATTNVNIFSTYDNYSIYREFNDVVLSILTENNDELILVFVKKDSTVQNITPNTITDIDSIEIRNVILKVSTSKTYDNAIIDLRVCKRNNKKMSLL